MAGAGIGVMLPCALEASEVIRFVVAAENLGFGQLWIVEDLGFRGGIAQAAVALGATRHIRVGIGVLPAGGRNVAFAAMEVATLCEMFPGRLDIAFGHGMPDWMRSVGAWPEQPLALLEEYIDGIRVTLAGGSIDVSGQEAKGGFALNHPPECVPRVFAGVRRKASLEVSGRLADGTVLSEPTSPEYLAWALEFIQPPLGHEVVAYNLAAVSDREEVAIDAVRGRIPLFSTSAWTPHVKVLNFSSQLAKLRACECDDERFIASIPDDWVRQLALVGTPASVRSRMEDLESSGATAHVLIPCGVDPLASLVSLARVL